MRKDILMIRYPPKFRHRPITGLVAIMLGAYPFASWCWQSHLIHRDIRVLIGAIVFAFLWFGILPYFDFIRKWFLLSDYRCDGCAIEEVSFVLRRRKLLYFADIHACRPLKYGAYQGYMLLGKDGTKICMIDAFPTWSEVVKYLDNIPVLNRSLWILG